MSQQERFSRWLIGGLLYYAMGLLAAVFLRATHGIPFVRTVGPVCVLATLVLFLFHIPMYLLSRRFKSARNLRPAALLTGLCALAIGLVGMYYAGQIGLSRCDLLRENYLSFSIYVVLCTGIAGAVSSHVKL
jgi:apolipoprotein N-acyltransferase